MNRNEARIALAERMGWARDTDMHSPVCWVSPSGEKIYTRDFGFDPFTNSADCDALLDWLVVSEGYFFDLESMVAKGVVHLVHLVGPEDQEGYKAFPDWTKRHEAITLCACEALGIECDE